MLAKSFEVHLTLIARINRLEQTQNQNHAIAMNELFNLCQFVQNQLRAINNNILSFNGTIQGDSLLQQ